MHALWNILKIQKRLKNYLLLHHYVGDFFQVLFLFSYPTNTWRIPKVDQSL